MSKQGTFVGAVGALTAIVVGGVLLTNKSDSSPRTTTPAVTAPSAPPDSMPGDTSTAASAPTDQGTSEPIGSDSTKATLAPAVSASSGPAVGAASFTNKTAFLSDISGFGKPYQDASVPGILTFRGNLTRSYDGTGPVPRTKPRILWKSPGGGMCGKSSEYHQIRVWCGTGWTGQPAVFEYKQKTWVVFGAYDYKIHFLDAESGKPLLPAFKTGDLAKGNVTIDPNGYPLVYQGSRDNYFRIVAFDGTQPRELFRQSAVTPDGLWNNDWDAAALVVGDYLLAGSENSWFYGWKLNRGYAADGSVTVAPKLMFRVKGWDSELLRALPRGDHRVSIEASVSVAGNIAWFNNSGGLLQGWDLTPMIKGTGEPTRVFRFWGGDDSDSSIVIDEQGMLYAGVEGDRLTKRMQAVGNLLKIDPTKPDNPVVWSIKTPGKDNGTWSTPAFWKNTVVWPTKPGTIYGIDKMSGKVLWQVKTAGPQLSSPNIVDGVLVQADGKGVVHAWDLGDGTTTPKPLWTVDIGTNIETTPAIWKGRIYFGSRDGFEYCLGL